MAVHDTTVRVGRRGWRRLSGALIALLLGSLLMTGCQLAPSKSDRVRVDWSRGQNLGRSVNNARPALAPIRSGETFLVWAGQAPDEPSGEEGQRSRRQALHWSHLGNDGRVLSQGTLAIETDRPTDVEVLATASGNMHLFWLDRLDGATHLFHAGIDPHGEVVQPAARLPIPGGVGSLLDSFAAGSPSPNEVDLLVAVREWEQAGLYHLRLDQAGQPIGQARLLRAAGYEPSMGYDGAGTIHLTWLETPDYGERRIYYAHYAAASGALSEPALLSEFPVPIGMVARRPAIGLAKGQVYVFWSVERRGGGLSLPSSSSYYLSFPIGAHAAAGTAPQAVLVPSLTELSYRSIESVFGISQLAPADENARPARFVYLPSANPGNLDQLTVAFSAELSGRTQSDVQIVLTLWDQGRMVGHQIAAKTGSSSLHPNLRVDENGDLHLAWVDTAGFGAYDVYYASTADAVEQHVNRLTPQDVASAALEVVWGVGQSLSFLPLVLVWIFLPLILMAAYVMIRAESRLDRQGTRIVLIVSMLLYTVFKYLFRAGWLAALPLPYGTPTAIVNLVSFAMPVVISGLAAILTWLYARHSETASIFTAFAVFAVCDTLLTVLIYVPGILAE